MDDRESRCGQKQGRPERKHVSVVYFHGMGSQRHYEELSRLVEALENYAHRYSKRPDGTGRLADIEPRIEKSSFEGRDDITYVKARYVPTDCSGTEAASARFYEVYWAPVMAKEVTFREVVPWLFSTILRPLEVPFSPWRERKRLRRMSLLDLLDRKDKWKAHWREQHFQELLSEYEKFDRQPALADFPDGSFAEFLQHLEKTNSADVSVLKEMALTWRNLYRLWEIENFLKLFTIGLALVMGFVLTLALALVALKWAAVVGLAEFLTIKGMENISKAIMPNLGNAIFFAVGILSLVGMKRYFTAYLGDVQQWVTYEETDRKHRQRKAVLKRGTDLMRHVLANDGCSRVVVVAHSLGTAIAQDVLLALTRMNRVENAENPIAGPIPLLKIEHFITSGSPIDKVHYLFESFRSRHHLYRRVIEDLRGDLGTAPFAKNRWPHVHWINYWDRGDLISGPLSSPSNGVRHRVDNVELSQLRFVDPAGAHGAYFQNRRFIGDLFDIIFKRSYSFATLTAVHGEGKNYKAAMRGGEECPHKRSWLSVLAVALPYVAAAAALLNITKHEQAFLWVALVFSGILAVLGVGWLWNRKHGNLDRI